MFTLILKMKESINENKGLCEICFEKYDHLLKKPKKMNCCGKVICLKCLKDIYELRKMTTCPMCCCDNMINPDELPTQFLEINQLIICPHCHRDTMKSSLYYSLTQKTIKCSKCSQEDEIRLVDYIIISLDEISSIVNKYAQVSNDALIDLLLRKIKSDLDSFFDDIKIRLITKLKAKITNEFKDYFNYDSNSSSLAINNELTELNELIEKMQHFVENADSYEVSVSSLLNDISNCSDYKDTILSLSSNFKK